MLVIFVPNHHAKADWWDLGFSSWTVGTLINSITTVILGIVGKAIEFFAKLLDSFISYQTQNGVYNVAVVNAAWGIIRDFVNMFFILVLIVMAFGTIFGLENYSWRKLLISFIISALLVNFSLTIGQYIITVSNDLAGVFLKQIQVSGGCTAAQISGQVCNAVSNTFANGTNIAGIQTSGSTNLLDGAGAVIITEFFAIIFLTVVALAFAATALFSIVRLFVLWALLIVSPIAWLGYAIPGLRKNTWSIWWKNFLCWCFFLPYFLFFVMFAVMFVANKSQLPPVQGSDTTGGLTGSSMILYGLSLTFLLGGIYYAKKLACSSGNYVNKAFGAIEGGVKKYAPGAGYVRGGWQGAKQVGEKIQEKGVFGIGGAQKTRETEAKARGFIAGLGGVPGANEELSRAQSTEVDKEVKNMQQLNLNLDQLNDKIKSGGKFEKIAAFKLKSERGNLDASDVDKINTLLREAGGGRTALGASIISSLKKGKFNEMALSTADKEHIFDGLEDTEVKKAFGLDMAESKELMDADLARKLLNLYSGDAKDIQDKVKKAVKENIDNMAKKDSDRKDLLNATGAFAGFAGTDPSSMALRAMAGQAMVDKKEINNWETRRQVLALNGGIDPATGDAKTVEGRKLASDMKDNNAVIREEAEYRKNNPGTTAHATNLTLAQHDSVSEQILNNIEKKLITSFTAEELKTPEVFNALFNGYLSTRLSIDQFNKLAGLATGKGGGKPDRKKREAGAKIEEAIRLGTTMPY